MSDALTMIGFPEKILRYAAAGILIEEGEVSRELALSVATGEFRLDHYPKIDGRVMHAIRKAASVMMTLRSHDMLLEPSPSTPSGEAVRGIEERARENDEHFAWLIEDASSPSFSPSYWGGIHGWTTDNLKAIQFSRQEDALSQASTMGEHLGKFRIKEHGWS